MVNVYSASTGRSLYCESAEVNEEEQQYVKKCFRNGIRLSIDPAKERVTGSVTVVRKTEEPLIFVTRSDNSAPITGFLKTVQRICDEQETWILKSDREEVAALEAAGTDKDKRDKKTTSDLSSFLKRPKETKSSHDDYVATIKAMAQVLSKNHFDSICTGRILLTKQKDPALDIEINHVCVIQADSITKRDPEYNTTGILSWLQGLI